MKKATSQPPKSPAKPPQAAAGPRAGAIKPPLASGMPVHCAHTQVIDVDKLVPNPRNPNQHSEQQIALLAKIIKGNGWRAPIVVSSRSFFVVKGHGRLLAARALKLATVPVDYQNYASEAEEWSDMLADNKIAELAELDFAAVSALLKELDAEHLQLTGFPQHEIENLLAANWTPPAVEPMGEGVPGDPEDVLNIELSTEARTLLNKAKQKLETDDDSDAIKQLCEIYFESEPL